jgi:hypothetical protein
MGRFPRCRRTRATEPALHGRTLRGQRADEAPTPRPGSARILLHHHAIERDAVWPTLLRTILPLLEDHP